jgi:hypothetical protein
MVGVARRPERRTASCDDVRSSRSFVAPRELGIGTRARPRDDSSRASVVSRAFATRFERGSSARRSRRPVDDFNARSFAHLGPRDCVR